MKKYKVGQKVYYYYQTSAYLGSIVECTITKAIKDLNTGKVTYTVSTDNCHAWLEYRELTADYLYPNISKIKKEHKDELAYGALMSKLTELEKTLSKILDESSDKIEASPGWATISSDLVMEGSRSIIVDGIGDLKQEFDKLKKEITDIKKKIKKPTKKTVVKKEESKA